MPEAIGSGCINHPSVEAAGRCKQCGKPFCTTCHISGPTGNFCSEGCKAAHENFTQRAQQLDSMQKSAVGTKLWFLGKKILFFGVIIVIVGFVAGYFGIEVPVLSNLLRSVTGQ